MSTQPVEPSRAELLESLSSMITKNHEEMKESIGSMKALQAKTIKKVIVNSREIEDLKRRQAESEHNSVVGSVR